MSAIGGIVNSAVNAVTGGSSGTTLQDFLSQFSSSDGVWAKTIDPYASFDVSIKFYPTVYHEEEDKGWLGSLESSAKSMVKNAANNLTGGLLGSLMNSKVDVMEQHNKNKSIGKYTFMEYLAAANLIVGQEDWIGEKAGQAVQPLVLQLGPYCQSITIPHFEVTGQGTSTNQVGEFPINGTLLKTDSQILSLKIVNTKVALHERIFYPWLRETVLPFWSYKDQPYTTATITVDFTKHNDVKYVFYGCRPQKIMLMQASQEADSSNITRDVSFTFDCMFINSSLTVCESFGDKIMGTVKNLASGAGSMLNI